MFSTDVGFLFFTRDIRMKTKGGGRTVQEKTLRQFTSAAVCVYSKHKSTPVFPKWYSEDFIQASGVGSAAGLASR